MAMTNFAKRRFLNSFLGGATPNTPNYGQLTPNAPTHLAAALDTGTPTDAGANFNEPPGADGYARIPLSLGSGGDFTIATDADPSLIENSAALTFSAAQNNNWGNVAHVGFFDAASGGNLLFHLTLDTPRTINIGETLSFAAGELELTAN